MRFAILLALGCAVSAPGGNFGFEGDPVSAFPPDGWSVTNGVWGTDMNIDTTVQQTVGQSIKFSDAGEITSDVMALTPFLPLGNAPDAFVGVFLRADRITAGDNVTVKFERLDKDLSLVNTTTIHNTVLAAANTWEEFSARFTPTSGEVYGRFIISKANTAFIAWVDHVYMHDAPLASVSTTTSGQSISDNTWTALTNTAGSALGVGYNSTTDTFTIARDGFYLVSCRYEFASLSDGQLISIRLNINSGATYLYGEKVRVGAAGTSTITLHYPSVFAMGDTIEIEVFQTGAATSRTLQSGSDIAYTHIVELSGQP